MSIDMSVFLKNQAAIAPESLLPFAGQWVAWAPDGTRIVAASPDSEEALDKSLLAQGWDLSRVVFDYIPDGKYVNLGGPWD